MKPYTMMYRQWIGVPGVGAAEIAVLSGLYARADAEGVCAGLVQDELAAELGKSRPWLSAVLAGLQQPAVGLVEAHRRKGFRGFTYALANAAGAATDTGQPADTKRQPADASSSVGIPSSPDSKNSSSRRAGEALAEDWQPTADDLAWAVQARPDVVPAAVTAKFVSWCRKAHGRNGYTPSDPSAAWRRWIARELVAPAGPDPAAPSMADSIPPTASNVIHLTPAEDRPVFRSERHDRRDPAHRRPVSHRCADVVARNADTLAALRDRLSRRA